MRTLIWVLVILAAGAAGLAYINRDLVGFVILKARLTPAQPYSDATAPPAPDYSDPKSWAALPDQADGADLTIPGKIEDNQANAQADVFFILPTTYLKGANWNGPIEDADANRLITAHMLPAEASVFNGCCKIYAPRYRQATFAAFLDKKGNGDKAIDLAYKDVAAAFDYFLAHYNRGRPLVLAAHSQGSVHLLRLIKEHVTGTPLAKQMVVAYAIGWNIKEADLKADAPDVPVCSTSDETSCLVSWNSVGPHAKKFFDPIGDVCVNPLTWKTDGGKAAASLNHGALVLRDGVRDIQESAADAQCIDGRLVVTDLRATPLVKALKLAPINLGNEVYHVIDFPLFYMNLRENAAERVARVVPADGPAPTAKLPKD